MQRKMTQDEKRMFGNAFPALDVENTIVTGEESTAYNNIAWALGLTNMWINPSHDLRAVDDLFNRFGLIRTDESTGSVLVMMEDASPTSASRLSENGQWETKCGQSLRILHNKEGLVGPIYGKIAAYYKFRKFTQANTSPDDIFSATRE